jgi:mitogen-activated protein kinase 1/3
MMLPTFCGHCVPAVFVSSLVDARMSDSRALIFELPALFKVDAVVGQGAYGAVCRAAVRDCDHVVAIKKIPQYAKSADTAKRVLREVLILQQFQFVRQIVAAHMIFRPVSAEKDLYVVMDYVPSDLSTFIKQTTQLNEPMIQYIVAQLLLGLRGIHAGECIHRDLSTRNVLLNERCEVQIADFGLARFFDPEERMSFGVVTQWYRAPEIITDANYTSKVDVWSVGVIMAELYMQGHIFPGKPNDLADQLNRIMKILGVPDVDLFVNTDATLSSSSDNAKRYIQRVAASSRPYKRTLFEAEGPRFKHEMSEEAKTFMSRLLCFNPDERPSAEEALKDKWFEPLRAFIDENLQVQDCEQESTATTMKNEVLNYPKSDVDQLTAEIERLAPQWNKELEQEASALFKEEAERVADAAE